MARTSSLGGVPPALPIIDAGRAPVNL